MRHKFILICMIPLTLAACTEKPLLTLEEKARFTVELIADRSDCKVYKQRLAPPVTDRKLIEQTYEAAKVAHCLTPDV